MINNDSKQDIVTVSFNNDTLFWNESTVTDDYTEHEIPCSIDGPTSIFVYDVNDDNFDDLIVSSFFDDSIWEFRYKLI